MSFLIKRARLLAFVTALVSTGCAAEVAPVEEGETSAEDSALAAEGVLMLSAGKGLGGLALTGAAGACVASGVCIAGVVLGVVVVGGLTYLAFEVHNSRDAWHIETADRVDVHVGGYTIPTSTQANPIGPFADYLRQGVSFGPYPEYVTELTYAIAVQYYDYCSSPAVAGGAACLAHAREFLSCVSYDGGASCIDVFNGAVAAVIVAIPGATLDVNRDLERMRASDGNSDIQFQIGNNGGNQQGCVVSSVQVAQSPVRFEGRGRFDTAEMAPVAWFESLSRSYGQCAVWHMLNHSVWAERLFGNLIGQIGATRIANPFAAMDAVTHCWLEYARIEPVSACGGQPMLSTR